MDGPVCACEGGMVLGLMIPLLAIYWVMGGFRNKKK